MATATQKEYVVKEVTLGMSEVEANFLADLLKAVVGNPDTTRRRHADAMLKAMDMVGVTGYGRSDIRNTLRVVSAD
jgi:hypothetical protein